MKQSVWPCTGCGDGSDSSLAARIGSFLRKIVSTECPFAAACKRAGDQPIGEAQCQFSGFWSGIRDPKYGNPNK
jgi:hypothetical protein